MPRIRRSPQEQISATATKNKIKTKSQEQEQNVLVYLYTNKNKEYFSPRTWYVVRSNKEMQFEYSSSSSVVSAPPHPR